MDQILRVWLHPAEANPSNQLVTSRWTWLLSFYTPAGRQVSQKALHSPIWIMLSPENKASNWHKLNYINCTLILLFYFYIEKQQNSWQGIQMTLLYSSCLYITRQLSTACLNVLYVDCVSSLWLTLPSIECYKTFKTTRSDTFFYV